MMDKLKIFLNDYADAVLTVDIMKISSFFNDSFVLSTQKDYWHIKNNDEFRTNLKKTFSDYENLGAHHCKLLTSTLIHFNSNHCVANIEWGLLDNKQNIKIRFDISYVIKEINNTLRFIFVIDHNEIERIAEYKKNEFNY